MAESLRTERIICLFNCDNLYDLNIVESLLREVEPELPFTLSVIQYVFRLREMESLSEEVADMDMDYAVFVVHANESRLSINEKDAGIGYARLYTALLEKTGDRVLVILGGDIHYKGEEDEVVLSNWAKYKISSQFTQEYLDGRKSFVLSWNKKPNPIHSHALKHFFFKQGQVFEIPQEIKEVEKQRLKEMELKRYEEEKVHKNTKQLQQEKCGEQGQQGEKHQLMLPETNCSQPDSTQMTRYLAFIKKGKVLLDFSDNPSDWKPPQPVLDENIQRMRNEDYCLIEIHNSHQHLHVKNLIKYSQKKRSQRLYRKLPHTLNYQEDISFKNLFSNDLDSTPNYQSLIQNGQVLKACSNEQHFEKILKHIFRRLPNDNHVYYVEMYESEDSKEVLTKIFQ